MSQQVQSIKPRFIKLLLKLLACMPLRIAHVIGAGVGLLMWQLGRRGRETSLRNLELCFPEMGQPDRERLAKASMMETGKNIAELGALWLWPIAKTLSLVKQVSGEHYVTEALAKEQGIIFVSPHLGAWELSGLYCATKGYMTSLYRPPKLQGMDELIRYARQRGGAALVPTDAKGVKALLQGLKRGELTGILPDQDPGFGNGEFAPFFGVPANTMTLLSKLAFRSQSPVILIYAERLPKGEGFHLHLSPIELDYEGADVHASLVAINQAVERAVRESPAQYQWSYKRFKSRPEGESPIY